MRPGVLHALEGDDALVVGVSQQRLQKSDRDRVGRFAGSWRDGEAAVVEVVGQLPHRPVTGRILGKRQPDQRCALVIQGDRPDLPPVLVPGADFMYPSGALPSVPPFLAFSPIPLMTSLARLRE